MSEETSQCAGPCSDKRGSGTFGDRGLKSAGLILSRTILNRLVWSTSDITILGKVANPKELSSLGGTETLRHTPEVTVTVPPERTRNATSLE